MEMDSRAYPRSGEIGTATALRQAGDHQRDLLHHSQRGRLADDAQGSSALAHLLPLLCTLAEGGRVGANA